MFFRELKKENEFLKREIAALLERLDPCEICVFRGTMPDECIECMSCKSCESDMKKTWPCCSCDKHFSNFLWDGGVNNGNAEKS